MNVLFYPLRGKRDFITYANSKGSGEPAHIRVLARRMRRLARTHPVRASNRFIPNSFTRTDVVAHVCGKSGRNFSQDTGQEASLRDRACAVKD